MNVDGLVAEGGVVALLAIAGGAIAILGRTRVDWRWLVAAAGLLVLNDALLTRGYGLIPGLLPHAAWNWQGKLWHWQGKLMALAATLLVAAAPWFGWRRCGLTLVQRLGSLRGALVACTLYALLFVGLALAFPASRATGETVAFQLTLPGLEEEPFYRGVLLLALDRAFAGRIRLFGVEWGWGAVLSCALFGLAHAFGFSKGAFSFDATAMALTAVPAFLAVWLRLRTGSLLIPVLLHNFGNAIGLMI